MGIRPTRKGHACATVIVMAYPMLGNVPMDSVPRWRRMHRSAFRELAAIQPLRFTSTASQKTLPRNVWPTLDMRPRNISHSLYYPNTPVTIITRIANTLYIFQGIYNDMQHKNICTQQRNRNICVNLRLEQLELNKV